MVINTQNQKKVAERLAEEKDMFRRDAGGSEEKKEGEEAQEGEEKEE